MTTCRYPPPPGARLPVRVRVLSWWARGAGDHARRWARLVDSVVVFVMPLLMMAALLLAVAQDRPAPMSGSCTLVGSTWSCTR